MPKETATPTPLGLATATNLYINPKATATSLVDIPAPFIPPPKLVTPKSFQGPWGGFIDRLIGWVNNLFHSSPNSIVAKDLLWLTKVNVVEGDHYYCIGGPMCPNARTFSVSKAKVLIMPEGVIAPKVSGGSEEDFFPALCLGSTGAEGCINPIPGHRLNPDLQSNWQWSLDNYFFSKYTKSLPGIYEFELPISWEPGPGTYQLTAYINYDQQAFLENYDNNYVTFSFTITGDSSIAKALPASTSIPDNLFYFENKVIVLQNENCVQGCAVTTNGLVNAGQSVEVYLQALQVYPNNTNSYFYISDPKIAAMSACKGATGQNGCSAPLSADSPPYDIPQWFLQSPDAYLLVNQPGIVRFTLPANQISSPGIYKFNFYVNYQQQAAPEKNMSDNTKTIYLNAVAVQQ